MKEIFAWATFDGEGSYDLRLYEDNENYLVEWISRNGEKYRVFVKAGCFLPKNGVQLNHQKSQNGVGHEYRNQVSRS